jgi:hypothetical protein
MAENSRNTKYPKGRRVKIGDNIFKSMGKAAIYFNTDAKTISYKIKRKMKINGLIGEFCDEINKEPTKLDQ